MACSVFSVSSFLVPLVYPFFLYSFFYVSRVSWYFLVLSALLGLSWTFLVVAQSICIRLEFCRSSAQIIYLLVLKL